MSCHRLARNYGYTLLELILAVAIIGTISAAAIPNYAKYVARAREKACSYNRQAILYEYQLYCISEMEIPLSDYISTYWGGEERFCPSGGTHQASGSGEDATLTCSLHQDIISTQTEASDLELLTDR